MKRFMYCYVWLTIKQLAIFVARLYVWTRCPDVKERYLIERDTASYLGESYPNRWCTLSESIHGNPKDPRGRLHLDSRLYRFLSTNVYHYDSYSEYAMNTKNHRIHEENQENYRRGEY